MENKNENITFEELLNQTLKDIKVGQTVTGTVVDVTEQNEGLSHHDDLSGKYHSG